MIQGFNMHKNNCEQRIIDLELVIPVQDLLFPMIFNIMFLIIAVNHDFFDSHAITHVIIGENFIICKRGLLIYWIWWIKMQLKLLFVGKVFGLKFSIPNHTFLRRSPTKDVLNKFSLDCKVTFKGIIDLMIPNMSGVLHPIDFFVDGLYRIISPKERLEAMSTYKRTNPTLPLRLNELDKYGERFEISNEVSRELDSIMDEIMDEVCSDKGFDKFRDDILHSTRGDFDNLRIDGSSAAGYPYPAGTKRREVYHKAIEHARLLLEDEHLFDEYMHEHVWYTTGRAKLQKLAKDIAARLICYGGFASMVISMLYFQIWQSYMNKMKWCAVGMSWMDKGAEKFAKFFGDVEGLAPKGYKYCVLDMKSWDSSVESNHLDRINKFHCAIMNKAGVNQGYVRRFHKIMKDMINAVILMPMGFVFRTYKGIKSGWANTANDNTLCHEIIFRYVERTLGVKMLHKLYGDDNLFLIPDHVEAEDVIAAYKRCGITVGKITVSSHLADTDFLSKNIIWQDGEYFIFRESVETHARLLMPEEMDPSRRDIPDARIAAEKLIGHLYDNPFNANVRESIYKMLEHIHKHYQINEVIIDPDDMKKAPWRFIDAKRVAGVIPIIPDFEKIKELYGVGHVMTTIIWPGFSILRNPFSFAEKDANMERFITAQNFYKDVWDRVLQLTPNKRKKACKQVSPFLSPTNAKGFHGGRFEYAVKHFGIKYSRVLDYGSHPGAAAFSIAKKQGSQSNLCYSIPSV